MSELTNAKRKSINDRLAVRIRIRDSFKDRQYVSQNCSLCSWASNGKSLDEAIAANQEHMSTVHPNEERALRESEVSPEEMVESVHDDHECQMARCVCTCGCSQVPFCMLVFGPLCSTCFVREIRGDREHGNQQGKA